MKTTRYIIEISANDEQEVSFVVKFLRQIAKTILSSSLWNIYELSIFEEEKETHTQ